MHSTVSDAGSWQKFDALYLLWLHSLGEALNVLLLLFNKKIHKVVHNSCQKSDKMAERK